MSGNMQLLLHQGDKLYHTTQGKVAIAGLLIQMLYPKMGQSQLSVAEVTQLSFSLYHCTACLQGNLPH